MHATLLIAQATASDYVSAFFENIIVVGVLTGIVLLVLSPLLILRNTSKMRAKLESFPSSAPVAAIPDNTIACPHCSAHLTISAPGRYTCPKCNGKINAE